MEGLYEEEISTRLAKIRNELELCTTNIDSDKESISDNNNKNKNVDNQVDVTKLLPQIELIEQTISLLETEARSSRRKGLKDTVNQFRKEVKEMKIIIDNIISARKKKQLLSSGGDEDEDDDVDDPLLSKQQQALSRSGTALENSKRRLVEIEQVAVGITESLDQSTSSLQSIRRKVQEAAGATSLANGILNSMELHNTKTKLILRGVVCFVLVVIIFGFYYILFHSATSSSSLSSGGDSPQKIPLPISNNSTSYSSNSKNSTGNQFR